MSVISSFHHRSRAGVFLAKETSTMDESISEESSTNANSQDRQGDGGSTTGSRSGTAGDDDAMTIRDQLSKQETKAVFRTKLLVVLILIAAAAALSVTVFYITRNADKDEFESQYEGVADKIIQSFENIFVEMAAVSGLGVAASAHSVDHKSDWPFVTLSNFQQRAGNARALSGSLFVQISPLVEGDLLAEWEGYVRSEDNYWIDEGFALQEADGLNNFTGQAVIAGDWLTRDKVDPLHTHDNTGNIQISQSEGPYLPVWQTSPVVKLNMVNENMFENEYFKQTALQCLQTGEAVLGGFVVVPAGSTSHAFHYTAFIATLLSMLAEKQVEHAGDPMSLLAIPVFDAFDHSSRAPVGVMSSLIHWQTYFSNILPSNAIGITVVLENSCGGFFTYEINGDRARPVGYGDIHDTSYEKYRREGSIRVEKINDGTSEGLELNQEGCPYLIHVYPSEEYYDSYIDGDPVLICIAVALVFAFTILMFFVYDRLVERRQKLVLAKATQSTAIVSSLFPKQVRDRLMATEQEKIKGSTKLAPNHRLKNFLNGAAGAQDQNDDGSQPIADLFPHCTVFFADISGFTAWSSAREPAQVFTLLQAVYQAFDIMAKRRRVFKVETIGDSYVAATGLPEPQSNHATIMSKFAWECLNKVGQITRDLEVTLGPDTGDLDFRFGLHSGPVTAGVLKGDRARFQLFGDTVNTASRMESTGKKGRIQVSQSTADELTKAGKGAWLTPRDDVVKAKGKGVLKTFWLSLQEGSKEGSVEFVDERKNVKRRRSSSIVVAEKLGRRVDWTVDILVDHIRKMVYVRNQMGTAGSQNKDDLVYIAPEGTICLDEVKDSIAMPRYDANAAMSTEEASSFAVPKNVLQELREYVLMIAQSYRGNSFHNFEHACHVTMSATKILKRVVAPSISADDVHNLKNGDDSAAAKLHERSHGISSDPMAQFALTFAALIHNVDHQGISNEILMAEEPEMSKHYRSQCVAEQNSVDVAWDQLMSDQFKNLRKFVFGSQEELLRFRQIVVTMVLATDFCDKELAEKRQGRWDLAFNGESDLQVRRFNDYRATVVMEYVVQAADVSHCMQHWHVYQKWNRKLFVESFDAFKAGKVEENPSNFWYEGELKFFDTTVIPLAKKLIECDASGVNGDEFLNYALLNRAEWEDRGQDIVQEFMREFGDVDSCTGSTANASTVGDEVM